MISSFLDKLFRINSVSENSFSVTLADENHPVFLAHFESNPILPGFLHIDILASLYKIEVSGVKKAKYFEIIRPLETLTLKKISTNNKVAIFEVLKQGGEVASKIEIIFE